ncbi:IS21 family transposase, partial [Sansalvadorimonas sp. 2012CJ34-2]|nr:IS21 family transposase [Sansalvadorimonas sp. 2012CJ34-2]
LLNLQRDYGADRLNAACARARAIGGYRLKHIRSILQSGLDQMPLEPAKQAALSLGDHENIRGAQFFQ